MTKNTDGTHSVVFLRMMRVRGADVWTYELYKRKHMAERQGVPMAVAANDTNKKKKGLAFGAAAVLLFFTIFAFPLGASAASSEINSLEVTVDLHEDGSASFTELWNIDAISDMTEWYLVKNNLGDRVISNLQVTDENGNQFETVDNWDVDLSIDQKAGKCGILQTSDGIELCWGIGSLGTHQYTVTYDMTNAVQGYADADALYLYLVTKSASGSDYVKVTVEDKDQEFTKENTGIWAFGAAGLPYGVEDGVARIEGTDGIGGDDYIVLLLEFKKGMFSPTVEVDRSFGDLLEEAEQGSDYGDDYDGDSESDILGFIPAGVIIAIIIALFSSKSFRSGGASGALGNMKKEYKEAEYSRELPWHNNLKATYTRLSDLRQLSNEGTIIGAYFLRWIRTRQVELVSQQGGFFNKEETALKLYDPRPDMEASERRLYDMLVKAAGDDWILQTKEFEKWSKKHYEKVQGWLESLKNSAKHDMRTMGALTEEEVKVFFGLGTSRKTMMTPQGEELTVQMFGFKKYLKDFTIINEREAREVQLWDDYLVYAQVFGIADEVAGQFKKLYPDYFVQMANDLGMRYDAFDILFITSMANRYGRAMNDGYRAGYNAHVSRDSGGGGFSSGGGGFSAGGGGFSGGR